MEEGLNASGELLNNEEAKEIEEEVSVIEYESEEEYFGSMQQFYKDIQKYPLLSKEEEHDLSVKMFNGDKSAKEKMVNHNLRLAAHVARKYMNCGAEVEDLIQEACIGLMRATDTYNPTTGYRFSTYAFWWIRQAVNRYVDNSIGTIRIPVHAREKMRRIKRWENDYISNMGEKPSQEMVLQKCLEEGLSKENISAYQNMYSCVSLNQTFDGEDSDTELGELIGSDVNVEKEVEKTFRAEILNNAMEMVLTDKERWVMEHRFYQQMTLEECGNLMGVTRERVRQIESKAIRKMRHSRRTRGLRDLAC